MKIGSVSGYNSIMGSMSDYRINSIYGNPKSMDAIDKIGEEQYSGNPFAVVTKKGDSEKLQRISQQQNTSFDFDAAIKRANQGMTTSFNSNTNIDLNAEMQRMIQSSRFSAYTIPTADNI